MLSSLHPLRDREQVHRYTTTKAASRKDQTVGQDLFLDLALHEVDSKHGHKRQSLPVPVNWTDSHTRIDIAEKRPQSSSGLVAQAKESSPPALDPYQHRHSRHNTLQTTKDALHGLRALQTPTQHTARTLPQYAPVSALASAHDKTKRDWPRNPEMYHFGARRAPSSTFSEALPLPERRFTQNSTYEEARDSAIKITTQNTPKLTSTPTAQTARRPSDPQSESVGSPTAPSTVWDELDDLKSRIRNLEVTRKPLTTPAVTGQQPGERPRTATTAPTTISSSPRHTRRSSVVPSEVTVGGPTAASAYPLLHTALAKAKTLLSPQLYRSLESTAADALALAAMTGSSGPQGTTYSAASIISNVNVSDRHIRRKAENMCRNLTDLCIALCEGKHDPRSPISARPSPSLSSRFLADAPPSRYAPRSSVEQEEHAPRISPARTSASRLDGRRSSLLGLGLQSASPEPLPAHDISPGQNHVDYAARYSRPGTTMRLRNAQTDDQYEEPLSRAPSRAMTDLGQLRSRRSDGVQPRSPGLREALAARRHSGRIPEERVEYYASSPLADHSQDRTRAYIERQGAPASEVGSAFSSKRQRRITSLEQYTSATPQLAGGGTPMRTTSLSRRRNLVVE